MDERIAAILAEIAQQGREHDARETDYSKRMLNLDPETARLVHILARGSRAKSILEIGTSNGYSTIWLASAAAAERGRVVTLDHSSEKQAMARDNLRRAGLLESVELRSGKAATLVRELAGPFGIWSLQQSLVMPTARMRPRYFAGVIAEAPAPSVRCS